MAEHPNLADVAQAAYVSPMTASRAIRGVGSVAPDTAARVRAAAEHLGYVAGDHPQGRRNIVTPEQVRTAVARYGAGDSIRAIAVQIGVAYGTARTTLVDAGVPLRSRGGWAGRKAREAQSG